MNERQLEARGAKVSQAVGLGKETARVTQLGGPDDLDVGNPQCCGFKLRHDILAPRSAAGCYTEWAFVATRAAKSKPIRMDAV